MSRLFDGTAGVRRSRAKQTVSNYHALRFIYTCYQGLRRSSALLQKLSAVAEQFEDATWRAWGGVGENPADMNVALDTNGVERVHSTTGAFLVDFEDATLRAWVDNYWSGKMW